MKGVRQLYDPETQTIYTIDPQGMLFLMSFDDGNKQVRLKPHQITILFSLFESHPRPLGYGHIKNILTKNQLACPDETRLHRKVSELRMLLTQQHVRLNNFINNIRGVGYSLPLHLKNPEQNGAASLTLRNKSLEKLIKQLSDIIETSIELSKKCPVVKLDDIFVLKRSLVFESIEQLIGIFTKIQKELLSSLSLHSTDFLYLRIEFSLSKIKTYIGLARISEFAITKEQWLDWHQQETAYLFEELIQLIKSC